MARPRRCRCVGFVPSVAYFKPRGVPLRYLEEVCLLVEELEAMRLHDARGLGQEECGKLMNVSQPTFHRILESARRKVAEALVQGKALRIEGGDFEMAMRKFACRTCGNTWEVPFGTGQRGIDMSCPKCQSRDIHRIGRGGSGLENAQCRRQRGKAQSEPGVAGK
jgi:predicted DNA-binding protein (UPF0251 family)